MVKRKFSSERLYKVTKTLVIVISILIGLIPIYSLYELTHDVYTDGSGLLKRRHTWENERNLRIAFLVSGTSAVGLPTIFFVGGWIYRYLFPEVKED